MMALGGVDTAKQFPKLETSLLASEDLNRSWATLHTSYITAAST